MTAPRNTIHHPLYNADLTFAPLDESGANDQSLLIAVELGAGGGNQPHRHRETTEWIEVLSGEVRVIRGDEIFLLQPGDAITVPPLVVHQVRNDADHQATLRVRMHPAGQIEQALRIVCGLAQDGRLDAEGYPLSPLELGVFMTMSDTLVSRTGSVFMERNIHQLLATVARWRGVDRALARYL